LEVVAKNSRRETVPYAFFEAGPVFDHAFPQYERSVLAGIRSGMLAAHHWSQRARVVDLFDAKADLLALLGTRADKLVLKQEAPSWFHPGCSGTFYDQETPVGVFGLLHPEVLTAFDLDSVPVVGFELFLDALKEEDTQMTAFVAKTLPSVTRDFAFVVEKNLPAAQLVACVRQAGGPLVSRLDVFDVYVGAPLEASKKSIGLSVTFQPDIATLSEAKVQKLSESITHAISSQFGGVLR
jgi:phenylalanyl-tRNA synthetase beta chain